MENPNTHVFDIVAFFGRAVCEHPIPTPCQQCTKKEYISRGNTYWQECELRALNMMTEEQMCAYLIYTQITQHIPTVYEIMTAIYPNYHMNMRKRWFFLINNMYHVIYIVQLKYSMEGLWTTRLEESLKKSGGTLNPSMPTSRQWQEYIETTRRDWRYEINQFMPHPPYEVGYAEDASDSEGSDCDSDSESEDDVDPVFDNIKSAPPAYQRPAYAPPEQFSTKQYQRIVECFLKDRSDAAEDLIKSWFEKGGRFYRCCQLVSALEQMPALLYRKDFDMGAFVKSLSKPPRRKNIRQGRRKVLKGRVKPATSF